MADRLEELLAQLVDIQRQQLENQERALARQEQSLARQHESMRRARRLTFSVWALVVIFVLTMIMPFVTYAIRHSLK